MGSRTSGRWRAARLRDAAGDAEPGLGLGLPRRRHWPYFERLRAEDPVHFTPDSDYGPFWSITKYNDIMAVDTNHQVFSSADGIALPTKASVLPADACVERAPRDGARASSPWTRPSTTCSARRSARPSRRPTWREMAPLIRERAGLILDSLPIGEPFDWVDLVSKELTTMTLATLFDFPFEERRKLTHWSDMMTNRARPRPGGAAGSTKRRGC